MSPVGEPLNYKLWHGFIMAKLRRPTKKETSLPHMLDTNSSYVTKKNNFGEINTVKLLSFNQMSHVNYQRFTHYLLVAFWCQTWLNVGRSVNVVKYMEMWENSSNMAY